MRGLIAIVVAVNLAWLACAAEPEADMVKRVNRAIEKGKAALVRLEGGRGNWEGQETAGKLLSYFAEQNGGVTALATLALLTSGTPAEDKVVARGLDYLRNLELKRTYVVALTTMAFAEARQPRDLERIKRNADWLLEKAVYRGGKLAGWGYPHESPGYVDGSNTQYALLGLFAARQAGVKIDDQKWLDIRDLYLRSQKDESSTSAYWRYDLAQDVPQYGASFTMTVAGLCGLLISGMGISESRQRLDEATGVAANCGVYETNGPFAKGMNWVAARFSFDKAPNMKMSTMYNVYGIERLGRLSGQRFIGKGDKYDWYREGCKFLLDTQNDDGTWTRSEANMIADKVPPIGTSFALLFLCKGRTPLLITKFAHGDFTVPRGGGLVERGTSEAIVGWNRKQNDVRNLVEFASRELFNGINLGWQAYDSRKVTLNEAAIKAEVEGLLACPIVYMNGHGPIVLTAQQEAILKRYIDEGGFLFAEACCGDEEFAKSFHQLMRKLFPDNQLSRMPPEHPIWRSFFQVSPADFPFVDAMERGCKTVVVLTQTPMAGYWEESRFSPTRGQPATNRGQRAWQFAGNVIAYATGMQPPEQRGTMRMIVDADRESAPPRGAFKPVQLRLRDEPPPAPAAMRNLTAYLAAATNIDSDLKPTLGIQPIDPDLSKFKFVYLHGRKRFTLDDQEIQNLKAHLELDGLLFADAACGRKEFDESFRALMKTMFPDKPLEVIPPTDELYSEKINGAALRSVKRREKADGAGPDGGYKELPPHLEGIKIDGRWVVIYSKWDVGCALEKHNSTECLGHTPDSALRIGAAAVLYSLKR